MATCVYTAIRPVTEGVRIMSNTSFHNQHGRLTAYALACGYVESKDIGQVNVALWQEHVVFHVRAHDRGTGRRVFWESFRTMTEARRLYDRASKIVAQ